MLSQVSTGSTCAGAASSSYVSSEPSPSPVPRSRRTRGPGRSVHVTVSEFDTPVTANDNPGRTDKDDSLEENISKSSATPTMLEAPGKFVSRDMLSRTPLCPPPAPGDDSFPPPPPSEEMEAAKSNPEGMSRQISQEYDLPPPPDVFVTELLPYFHRKPSEGPAKFTHTHLCSSTSAYRPYNDIAA